MEPKLKFQRSNIGLPNPSDPLGYTSAEIKSICKKYKVNEKQFDEAFGANTCMMGEDGTARFYRCDVERALSEFGYKFHKGAYIWD